MVPSALLLGDPARLAFPGHLRLSRASGESGVAVAARVGADGPDGLDLVAAYRAARTLEQALLAGLASAEPDRHALLHALWEAVAQLPAADLGPAAGADLCLLAVAADGEGVGVAGVGLAGVWGRGSAGLAPLVSPGHPLLCAPGRPERTPGVLTLDSEVFDQVIAVPAHLDADLPAGAELARRCGVRP